MEGYRTCTECGRTFPETDEYFSSSMRRGVVCFESRCKECRRKYFREHYAKNREKYKQHNQQYYRDWWENNKEQRLEYFRNWRRTHPDDWKKYKDGRDWTESNKKYYATHKEESRIRYQKRKAREKDAESSLSIEQWESAKEEFGNACAYCGRETKLEQDHFIALSKGGGYTRENIVPSCKRCNCSKHANAFSEWYPLMPFYDRAREEHIVKYIERMKAI